MKKWKLHVDPMMGDPSENYSNNKSIKPLIKTRKKNSDKEGEEEISLSETRTERNSVRESGNKEK